MIEAAVLFSGGTDSTLSAARMLEVCDRVHLLTFQPGFLLFLGNTRKHAGALQRRYGRDRVIHRVLNNYAFYKRMVLGRIVRDLMEYGPNMCVHHCQGCRLAMHARAICYNLEHGIVYLADGSIRKQVAEPTQLEPIIGINASFYLERYGIIYRSPIFQEERSDLVLDRMGISIGRRMKREFIFFNTQATCPFGVPADVYGRIFYSRIMRSRQLPESRKYNLERRGILEQLVAEELGERLPVLVEASKRKAETVSSHVGS